MASPTGTELPVFFKPVSARPKFTLRMPRCRMEIIKRDAAASGLSVNEYIVRQLQRAADAANEG